jgi:hypothetical protein
MSYKEYNNKTHTIINFHDKKAKDAFMKTAILTDISENTPTSVTYGLNKKDKQMKAIIKTHKHLIYSVNSK